MFIEGLSGILSFSLSFRTNFNFPKNFFFFFLLFLKPGLVSVAPLNFTFCHPHPPPLPHVSLLWRLCPDWLLILWTCCSCLHGTSLLSWLRAVVVWVLWLPLSWLTPLCYWNTSSSSFLRRGVCVWEGNFPRSWVWKCLIIYSLTGSLALYRLLEGKQFSFRTLKTLLCCFSAPRVTVRERSGFGHV